MLKIMETYLSAYSLKRQDGGLMISHIESKTD